MTASDESPAASSSVESGSPAPAGDVRRHQRRPWRRRLFALTFGLALAFLVCELGVRAAWHTLAPKGPLATGAPLGPALRAESLRAPSDGLAEGKVSHLYRLGPTGVLRMQPNVVREQPIRGGSGRTYSVTTDARGLRTADPERAPPPDDALVVLVIGDSMTFGAGVDDAEAYPVQVEPLLAERLGRCVRVYNAGVVSLGQHEELALLEALLPEIEPDLVLLQFTVANDVIDDMRWEDGSPPFVRAPDAGQDLATHPLLANPLARWSRAYRLLAWRFGRHAVRYRVMLEPRHLDRAAHLVARGRTLCAPRPFAVLIAPNVAQVEGHLAETILETARVNRAIAERLEAEGIPVLDPAEALRAAHAAGERLYIPIDCHWTPAGHEVVAEALVPFLAGLTPTGETRRP